MPDSNSPNRSGERAAAAHPKNLRRRDYYANPYASPPHMPQTGPAGPGGTAPPADRTGLRRRLQQRAELTQALFLSSSLTSSNSASTTLSSADPEGCSAPPASACSP